jgi:hypothetical protein
MNTYDKGETVVFNVEVRNQSTDVLFDPSSISITIQSSKQEVKVSEQPMIKTSTGLYSYEWTSDETGMYKVTYKALDGSKVTFEKDQFKII